MTAQQPATLVTGASWGIGREVALRLTPPTPRADQSGPPDGWVAGAPLAPLRHRQIQRRPAEDDELLIKKGAQMASPLNYLRGDRR
jgi:hypothetical protein